MNDVQGNIIIVSVCCRCEIARELLLVLARLFQSDRRCIPGLWRSLRGRDETSSGRHRRSGWSSSWVGAEELGRDDGQWALVRGVRGQLCGTRRQWRWGSVMSSNSANFQRPSARVAADNSTNRTASCSVLAVTAVSRCPMSHSEQCQHHVPNDLTAC